MIARLATSLPLLFLGVVLFSVPTPAQDSDEFSVLVYSKTNDYRHASIPAGVDAVRELGAEHGFQVEATEDSTAFRPERLEAFDVVVFLNTSGDVLGQDGQAAFRSFIENGGGYVGVHAAADTEYEWSWYGRLVGAYFEDHPPVQEATIHVETDTHPSTRMLPEEWIRTDEWYNYRSNPRERVDVLLTLDESTYNGGTLGDDHPIAWYHTSQGGRAWYTGGGHTEASFQDSLFRQHLLGGIRWAAQQE